MVKTMQHFKALIAPDSVIAASRKAEHNSGEHK